MNPLLVKAAPYVGISLLLLLGKCGYDAKQRQIGALNERLRISDSTLIIVRRDSARLVASVAKLRADSATLANQGVQTAATFRRELARWRGIAGRVDTVPVLIGDSTARDSIPTLAAVIAQANRTIASCQLNTANCEQRATNAEARVTRADSQRTNAERRAALLEQQTRDLRRLQPSALSNNVKLGGAVGIGFAICYFLCPKR